MCSQTVSLTWQFACLLLSALLFDNRPGLCNKQEQSIAASGRQHSLSVSSVFYFILLCFFFSSQSHSVFCSCFACAVSHEHGGFINSHPANTRLFSTLHFLLAVLVKDFPSQVFFSLTISLSLHALSAPALHPLSLCATVFTWPLHVT